MTSRYKEAYKGAKKQYRHCRVTLLEGGWDEIRNPVHIHHAKKTFSDEDIVVCSAWRYTLDDVGYLNAFVMCILDADKNPITRIYYSASIDPILYGLRTWYLEGGSANVYQDVDDACNLTKYSHAMDIPRYIRQRFPHGTVKAHVRAVFQYVKDLFFDRVL